MEVQPFFFQNETKKVKTKKLDLSGKVSCPCGLQTKCKTSYMKLYGHGKILIIGEAPGESEDSEGRQFTGQAGQRLWMDAASVGIRRKDCITYNAVNCRPPSNRKPLPAEITACRPNVLSVIKETKPHIIVLAGSIAIKSVLHERIPTDLMAPSTIRGLAFPDIEFNTWIIPVFHPSYLMRNSKDEALQMVNELDWKFIAQHIDRPVPVYDIPDNAVKSITDETEAVNFIESLIYTDDSRPVVIDYETTGLKPFRKGHEVVCVSFSIAGSGEAVCIWVTPKVKPVISKFLKCKRGKIAHNISFEDRWSREFFGTPVNNWVADTKLTAHVLDNRRDYTGLKFQTYLNFGIPDYSADISGYLKAPDSNSFNRVKEAPKDKLMLYCSKDSLFTGMLYIKQQAELDRYISKGNRLLLQGAIALTDDEANGLVIDLNYFRDKQMALDLKVDELSCNLMNSDIGRMWVKRFASDSSFDSNQQLAVVLKALGAPLSKTDKGNFVVDAEALNELSDKYSLAADILAMRKLKKMSGTYIDNWSREANLRIVNGVERHVLNGNCNIATIVTYRSSYSNPNIQNVPKHDKVAQEILRGGIFPYPGHRLLSVDYSGIEVLVSECNHLDPNMYKYLTDKGSDMHRDTAMDVYLLAQDEVSKEARQGAKNNYVFATFYGSYWQNTAKGLWKWAQKYRTASGKLIIDHLKKKGYGSYEKYERLIKRADEIFWGERFKVYAQWKQDKWKEYLDKGYIETLTGFRCKGLMDKMQVTNYPIQGPAFHCLLQAKILLKQWIKENRSKVLPVGQIHDDGMFSVPPSEFDRFTAVLPEIMCKGVMAKFKWINIPLKVEIQATEVNGSWFTLKTLEAV